MAKVSTPPPRDYAAETRDTLQAQIDLAPQRFAAEAEFRPKAALLDLQTLQQTLNGTGDTPGLLSQLENTVYPALGRMSAADRNQRIAGELGAIERYAPQVTRTLRQASGNAGLMDALTSQAQEGLDAGASLDPGLAREVEQGARSAQAARGMGFGNADAVAEAFARGERGNRLRNERRQFASQVVGLNQLTGGDPVMAILGRPSQTLSMGQSLTAQGQSFNPGAIFNPESAYAGDIFNTNFNADAAARIADANNKTALAAAGIQAAGSIGSSM